MRSMDRSVRALALTVMLLAVLVVLTPLAYASPPDPVWVSGFFDDDDGDNAVFLITSNTVALDPFLVRVWYPVLVSWPALAPNAERPAPTQYFPATDARAPPLV